MKVLVACKRGTLNPPRDNFGHCRCVLCKSYTKEVASKRDRTEYQREWRKRNADKCSSYSKKWIAANTEKRRDIEKSWKSRNPEKVKEINRKSGAKWAKTNKGIRNASVKRRSTAKINRTPPWANLEYIQKFYVDAQAVSKSTGIPHEVDHIIPLQGELVSGLHNEFNLQILPRSVNRAKKNHMEVILSEF